MDGQVVFFGNEKLATGIPTAQPIIKEAVEKAGFVVEQHVTGKLDELKPHKSKLAVLAAYGRIIPQRILDEFPLGIINIHPSLLPAYRGSTPIEQAILDGAAKTGVSIMRLTAGMDEGPLYKQKTLHLTGSETKLELTEKLQRLGSELLVEVLPRVASGNLKPRQQPHPVRATYSKLLRKEDGIIDWNKSAEQIEREIRAFAGWPGSHTTIAGKDVIITKAYSTPVQSPGTNPGEIEPAPAAHVIGVATGSGTLWIERLKPAGKNDMSAVEFIRGYLR